MSVPFTDAPPGCSLEMHAWVAMLSYDNDYFEVCTACGKQAAWMNLGS